MDVPRPLDLRQHDDVELVANGRNDLGNIVERPGRVQAIHAGPQAGVAEVEFLAHLDEALARRFLGVGGNGVLEIAQNHVDRLGHVAGLGADFFQMRRHEMDHALHPHGQVAIGGRRPDGERLVEFARGFHLRLRSMLRREISRNRRQGNSLALNAENGP